MTKHLLNVGSGDRDTLIPPYYEGWAKSLLDIDPAMNPDLCCDARDLSTLPPNAFDAIYCSHNLEHYYLHDAAKVLAGFHHVLSPTGFAEIRVPDMISLFKLVVEKGLDMDDVLYQSEEGPIMVCDVIYGFGKRIAESGEDFFAHKTGFSRRSLASALRTAGFEIIIFRAGRFLELAALAFKQMPTLEQQLLLRIDLQSR
jgi:hypothetical protein